MKKGKVIWAKKPAVVGTGFSHPVEVINSKIIDLGGVDISKLSRAEKLELLNKLGLL